MASQGGRWGGEGGPPAGGDVGERRGRPRRRCTWRRRLGRRGRPRERTGARSSSELVPRTAAVARATGGASAGGGRNDERERSHGGRKRKRKRKRKTTHGIGKRPRRQDLWLRGRRQDLWLRPQSQDPWRRPTCHASATWMPRFSWPGISTPRPTAPRRVTSAPTPGPNNSLRRPGDET